MGSNPIGRTIFLEVHMSIPVIQVSGSCLPDVWEKAVLRVYSCGTKIKTEYDNQDDPPSRDAMLTCSVHDPNSHPKIHKNIPGGPGDLEIYKQEVINGVHDHWIDPDEGKWSYTYHERLTNLGGVNQIKFIADKLSETPYSRRAQAITWSPGDDAYSDDPPCLQRIWARLIENGSGYNLDMHTFWRSRDLYKAWMMNAYAFGVLQKKLCQRISQNIEAEVIPGKYVDTSDSAHIYGKYMDEKFHDEIMKMKNDDTGWKNRAVSENEWDDLWKPMMKRVMGKLEENPDYPNI